MENQNKKVVIVGAGITGLTAAYYLQKFARNNQMPLEVRLVEASAAVGGKMKSVTRDGYTIERGPDSFLERKQSAVRLAKEVGIGDRLVNNSSGKSYLLVKDKLHPMPGGSIMGIPTQLGPFVGTKLLSWPGKIRAAGDFILPPSKMDGDQPLGLFFRRRFGDEIVDNLVEPLLSGIYAGDIDRMSLMATFPQYHKLEQQYGSLVRGMKKTAPKAPKQSGNKTGKKGIFLTVSSGLQSFAEAVEAKLEPGTVLKETRVDHVVKDGENGYRLWLSNGEKWTVDSVLVTTPHEAVFHMFSEYESVFEGFKDIPSTSVATVSMAFPKEAIKQDIDGTGFVVSRTSNCRITACTWTHKKWRHSAPEGKALLRCYVGRPGEEEIVEKSDEELVRIVLEDLKKTMEITAEPEFHLVTRWKEAMPQYVVGHRDRVEKLNTDLTEQLPGVFIAGCSYQGVGIPDCIDQGEAAVEKIISYLKNK